MPPVSKVMPLPTRTTGASFALPPMCLRTMNFGGSSLPLVTDRKLPIFSASSCLRSRTSTSKPVFLGQLLGGVGQVGRGADVGRQVAQFLRQVHAVGDRLGLRQRGLGRRGCGRGRARAILRTPAGAGSFLLFWPSVRNSLSCGARRRARMAQSGVALFHFGQRQCDNGVRGAQRGEGLERRADARW